MKTFIQKNYPNGAVRVIMESKPEDFEMVIDALANHPDKRLQDMATYLRKAIGIGR